jgi:hypothetical protein
MTQAEASMWREALAGMGSPALTAVLTVQCGLAWLRPGSAALRDEIDEAVTSLALTRPDVRIDRIVLHNLPAVSDLPPGDLADLNGAHADWLYRLAVTAAVLPDTRRPQVHRLFVAGSQRSVEIVDGIQLRLNGTWSHPHAAAAGLSLLRRAAATTPLTDYDIDLDGPFGDADPSVYL